MSNQINRREFFRQLSHPALFDATALKAQNGVRETNLTYEQSISRFLGQATLGADRELIAVSYTHLTLPTKA